MQRFRFNLTFAFLAMSNACVVVWAMGALGTGSNIALPLVATLTSLTCIGVARKRNAIVMGVAGGFAGMAALVLCSWLLHFIEYFSYSGNDEYWEDGIFFVYLVYVVVWGSFGAVVGMVCGGLVWSASRLFRSCFRSVALSRFRDPDRSNREITIERNIEKEKTTSKSLTTQRPLKSA